MKIFVGRSYAILLSVSEACLEDNETARVFQDNITGSGIGRWDGDICANSQSKERALAFVIVLKVSLSVAGEVDTTTDRTRRHTSTDRNRQTACIREAKRKYKYEDGRPLANCVRAH